jgi:hypothetical protein
MFPIKDGLKQEDAISQLFFNVALEYVIRSIRVNQDGLKLNGTQQLLVYAGGFNTGWRKKNERFSNNCNFVYFQYKKIVSTPKQPVINAVLINYIDYSITENYIGKMAFFLPYTRQEPLL